MTSLPALEVIATVTSVLVSFHPFGNAPSVVVPAGLSDP